MRESLKDFFEGVSIKKTIFLIIWTAGIIGWGYFLITFPPMLKQADWAYSEAMRIKSGIHTQDNTEVKDNGDPVESSDKTESLVAPIKATAEDLSSAPASGEIEKIILATFGKDEYQTARAVAFAESRLNAKATNTNNNGTTDCGVFQINSIHGLEDCADPHKNIEYAHKLFQKSGWSPWVAWKTGRYLAFM